MTPELAIELVQRSLYILILVSTPLVGTALVVGLLVSILQAATQINEMTLTFIPKLFAMVIVLLLGGPWMITVMTDFTKEIFNSIVMVSNI